MSSGEAPADPVEQLARERFGVVSLYPIQRFVIANVLESRPQIVVLPTGAGKSMCFQLPALLRRGPTLVLMPLLALLSDQLRKLRAAGFPAGALRGGLGAAEKGSLFDGLRSGAIRLLLATPEACMVETNMAALRSCGFDHLVVDEAHCISEWGDSFRPSYREVGAVARRLGVETISAFTATASPVVIDRIRALLFGDADVRVVESGADRPNIHYAVLPVLSRAHAFSELIRTAERPLLVFCRTRGDTEIAARQAAHGGEHGRAFFYHAGLSREERSGVETWYLGSTDGVLFATCAYGMGVDKPDIRTVVHADVPPSVEAYLQESGRAGRDGAVARAILMVSRDEGALPGILADSAARQRYERMLSYARGDGRCRRNGLLALIGQDAVSCAGCDVCDGTAAAEPAGEREILQLVRTHRRRFTIGQAAEILSAAPGPRMQRELHDCVPGFGSLGRWKREEVESAIRSLLAAGRLSIRARGFWAGKLTLPSPPLPSPPLFG